MERTSKPKLGHELKALGNDLAAALKQIRSSREFQDLEKEVSVGLKNISSSLMKGLKAAGKSKNASQLKSRLKRVAKAGQEKGREEALRAAHAAAQGIKRARKAVDEFRKRAKKHTEKVA